MCHTELFFDLVQDGTLSIGGLIAKRVSCLNAPQVYAALLQDISGEMGVVFEWP